MNDPHPIHPEPRFESFGGDPYRDWDAAYVLGALSPGERRAYEDHLAACHECQAAVAQIAGMPGLLAQLSPEHVATLTSAAAEADDPVEHLATSEARPDHHPSPDPVLASLLELDGQRRRLTRAVVGLAAALVLLAGVVGVAAWRGEFAVSRPVATSPVRLAFSPVVPTGITAVVDVVPVAAGTELRVECQYASDGYSGSYADRPYAIVVTDRSGHSTELKTWTAKPNRVMTPTGLSPLPVSEIAAVEIRTPHSSEALLRATVH